MADYNLAELYDLIWNGTAFYMSMGGTKFPSFVQSLGKDPKKKIWVRGLQFVDELPWSESAEDTAYGYRPIITSERGGGPQVEAIQREFVRIQRVIRSPAARHIFTGWHALSKKNLAAREVLFIECSLYIDMAVLAAAAIDDITSDEPSGIFYTKFLKTLRAYFKHLVEFVFAATTDKTGKKLDKVDEIYGRIKELYDSGAYNKAIFLRYQSQRVVRTLLVRFDQDAGNGTIFKNAVSPKALASWRDAKAKDASAKMAKMEFGKAPKGDDRRITPADFKRFGAHPVGALLQASSQLYVTKGKSPDEIAIQLDTSGNGYARAAALHSALHAVGIKAVSWFDEKNKKIHAIALEEFAMFWSRVPALAAAYGFTGDSALGNHHQSNATVM